MDLGRLKISKQFIRGSHGFVRATAAVLFLGGCASTAVEPPATTVVIPGDWSAVDLTATPVNLGQYWLRLGDPLVTQFVDLASANNRDIAVSVARVAEARAGLKASRAGYLPAVSASAGVDRPIGEGLGGDFQFSIGADASWEIDLFGQISSDVAASRAELANAGFTQIDVRRLIVGQAVISTIRARTLAEQLAIARSTLAVQDDTLQLARWRNQAGLVSSLDVEQARAQRAQTAATIPLLESDLAATANAISTLIGEPPGRVLAALKSTEPAPIPTPPALGGFEAPADVIRRRPDVRAAEARLYASAARIGIARARLLPAARLTGSISTGRASLGTLFDFVSGNVFAGLSQLLFDGGRAAAQVDAAEANTLADLAGYEQSILSALEEVETAAVDQSTADERVRISEEGVDAAATSALLARNQYEAGLIDFPTLLVVESQLLSARNQLAEAQAARAIAFVRLTQALGGGWSSDEYDVPLAEGDFRQGNQEAK